MTCGQSGVAMGNLWLLLAAGGVMAAVIGFLTLLNNRYTLNNIKSKTVGDGQHGTARWATDAEIRKAYARAVPSGKLAQRAAAPGSAGAGAGQHQP